jgi:DNA-binding GntR family transcriptional regulator
MNAQDKALIAGSDEWYQLNADFHRIVLEMCDNSALRTTLGRLYNQHRVLASARLNPILNQPRARNPYVLDEHRELLATIADGDGVRAEEQARQHVRNAFRRLAERGRQDAYFSSVQPP